jgi:hypothetical protein
MLQQNLATAECVEKVDNLTVWKMEWMLTYRRHCTAHLVLTALIYVTG